MRARFLVQRSAAIIASNMVVRSVKYIKLKCESTNIVYEIYFSAIKSCGIGCVVAFGFVPLDISWPRCRFNGIYMPTLYS